MIALASIAFNQPRLISEQIRLLNKYLLDPFRLSVYDASTKDAEANEIAQICQQNRTTWKRTNLHAHHEMLNYAAVDLTAQEDATCFGFLDHDIFPMKETRLLPLIEEAGFYGVGQRHPATGHLYLWPGFCFFSREWLNGRPLDFSGLRDGKKRNDGDTGSGLWPLFADEDWEKMFRAHHSHRPIRNPDGWGLQSWGYEVIGDWLHFSNGSGWMKVPEPEQRERLLFDLLAKA